METIGGVTALIVACGVIFTAIYSARNNTEKTLLQHIERLEEDIEQLKKERDAQRIEYQKKNDELFTLYQAEKERGDRLEKKVATLTRRSKK